MHKKSEIIFVIGVCLFVFCCFSIPIIIYATSSDVTPRQGFHTEIDVDNCPQKVTIFIRFKLVVLIYCLSLWHHKDSYSH